MSSPIIGIHRFRFDWYKTCLDDGEMGLQLYSQHSFYPLSKQLKPMGPLVRFDLQIRANRVNERIYSFLENKTQSNLQSTPFPDTLQSNSSFRVGVYGELGRGNHSEVLSRDLMCFLNEQRKFGSELQSYWAVFYDTETLSEQEFAKKVWQELAYISQALELNRMRGLNFSSDPARKNITFYINGDEFFVIGLHRNSADLSKRFHYATLVFSKDESLYPYQNH